MKRANAEMYGNIFGRSIRRYILTLDKWAWYAKQKIGKVENIVEKSGSGIGAAFGDSCKSEIIK